MFVISYILATCSFAYVNDAFYVPLPQKISRTNSQHSKLYSSNVQTIQRNIGENSLLNKINLNMAFSFDGRKPVEVIIETPSINCRRITSSILIDGSLDDVWIVLSDYNNLADFVPNLTKSYIVPGPPGKTRIFQEGAQKIIGFDFRASLTMDMSEDVGDLSDRIEQENRSYKEKRIGFALVQSSMFSSFDGEWVMRTHSRIKAFDNATKQYYYRYKTKLTYTVTVRPKGPVPVVALEWRIKEDVPVNLLAVKEEVETRGKRSMSLVAPATGKDREQDKFDLSRTNWGADETLGAYIPSSLTKDFV